MVGSYLFQTLIFGALFLSLWEETAWAGFVQTRLTARHGLVLASILTAVPFAVIHLPLYLASGAAGSELRISLASLFVMTPFYRYLLGTASRP